MQHMGQYTIYTIYILYILYIVCNICVKILYIYILYIYIYSTQHMCQNTIYESSQGPEDGQNLPETCHPSIQV